jgi:ferrous iron transport protein A
MMMKLSELKKGQKGKIAKIDGDEKLKTKIIRMGIFEGDEFSVDNVTPFNSNVVIKVKDIRIALRNDEAENIKVNFLFGTLMH